MYGGLSQGYRRATLVSLAGLLALAFPHAGGGAALAQQSTPQPAMAGGPSYAAITVEAVDFGFELPARIPAGLVTVTMTNEGKESHHAQIARLPDGKTVAELMAVFAKGEEGMNEALGMLTFSGGPGPVPPGGTSTATVNLTPGQYVLLCFIAGQDGVPHLAKGMVKGFEVVDPSAIRNTVTMKDFAFELPATEFTAGPLTFHVVNSGPQPHEMGILKLQAGKTMADLEAFMRNPQGQPPFQEAGGLQALNRGMEGWLSFDAQPGDYVAVCFVPDPETGKTHVELGMIAPFKVTAAAGSPQAQRTPGS